MSFSVVGWRPLPEREHMTRRELITAIGGATLFPLIARAQETGRTYRLGSLQFSAPNVPWHTAFFDALRRQGFIVGIGSRNERVLATLHISLCHWDARASARDVRLQLEFPEEERLGRLLAGQATCC
jgi:hypothetical protein